MSTSAQVIIKDRFNNKLYFYRHSDGFPSGTLPTLNKFLKWVKEEKIRDNTLQSAGWLILLGSKEYKVKKNPTGEPSGWKCGSYEPCTGISGTDWEYVIDLNKKEITYKKL